MYTDLSFITSSNRIGNDAANFFKNMAIANLDGHYAHLLVAPSSLKPSLLARIDEEIIKAQNGYSGSIILKMNSLTDRDIITKLSEASCAGVKISLIIRGICCLVPGIPGKTEHIKVISILGRFLEHSRIYCFGEGKAMEIFISSADIMTRNMEKRVEIACPIYDPDLKERILNILQVQLNDNVKARLLQSNKQFIKRTIMQNEETLNSQLYFMEKALQSAKQHLAEEESDEELQIDSPFTLAIDHQGIQQMNIAPRLRRPRIVKQPRKSRLQLSFKQIKKP